MEHILLKISIMLVPALLAVTLHEVAHGFSAEKLGDPTARLLGRLTLNPLKHLDPIGTIALLVFGFGWARPVPVNTNNLRRPQKDMIWVSLAGPLANLMLALFCALLLRVVVFVAASLPEASQLLSFIKPVGLMAAFGLYINIILCLFNLLPIPILDGGHLTIIAFESAIRRDLSLRVKERILEVGFYALILLMVVVLFNDIVKILPNSIYNFFFGS